MDSEEFLTGACIAPTASAPQGVRTEAAYGNRSSLAVRSLTRRFCEVHPALLNSHRFCTFLPRCVLGWNRTTVLGLFEASLGNGYTPLES
jgi:hypothetical protein